MIEVGLAHEIEEALVVLTATGHPGTLALIRRSAEQTQLARGWLHQQLDKSAS